MLKPSKLKAARPSEVIPVNPKATPQALQDLMTATQAYSDVTVCEECGSHLNLLRATLSRWGTGQSWEVVLPICLGCALQVKAVSASEEGQGGALQ